MAELLFVGPDDGVLAEASTVLGRAEPGWSILQIREPEAVADHLRRRPADLVLAYLDASVDEYQALFTSVLEISPQTIRYALFKAGDSIPCVVPFAHQCLAARNDLGYLQPIIAAGLAVAEVASKHPSLGRIIANLHDVPSPPVLYFDIRDQLEHRVATLATMAEITARDPSLVARILRIANSGFYALPPSVSGLSEAIGLIGTDALLGLVLAAHLYAGLPPPGLKLELLWQHTMKVSSLSRQITKMEGGDRHAQNTSAVAGLLHDIGLMVLLENEPVRYQPLWRSSGGDEGALAHMERNTFGVTHGELGALILKLWSLPQEVVDAVATSHDPGNPLDLSLTSRAVLAAEWLLDSSEGDTQASVPTGLASVDQETLHSWRAMRDELTAGSPGG